MSCGIFKNASASCTNIHNNDINFIIQEINKNTISWEQNITFPWNEKTLNQCLRWHILSYCFVVEETFKKEYFKMLRLTFSSNLDWGNQETATKKIRALSCCTAWGLLLFMFLCIYLSNKHRMLSCQSWFSSYYLQLLDKLQKLICRIVGPTIAASPGPFTNRWNVASLSLRYLGI